MRYLLYNSYNEIAMRSWSISEARSKISDMFDAALTDGPQRIERRDRDAVVVVSEEAWNAIHREYGDFADLLLNVPLADDVLPRRRTARVANSGD